MGKNNFIDNEKIVKGLTDAFLSHAAAIDKCADSFKNLDKSIPKSPSAFSNNQKEISKNIDGVTESTNKLTSARQKLDERTAEEIVNQRILNRNALQAATINSTLAGAYAKLSAEQAKSATNVQNLIARGRTATQTQKQYNNELKIAQKEFDILNKKVLLADRAVGKFNRNVGNYPKIASGFKDLLGAFGLVGGVTLIAAIAKDIFQTTKELQSLDLALKQVTETQEKYSQTQFFLSRVSEDYGIEIKGLTKQFTQFYVAAKDKISGKEIQDIFESVAKSAGFMGLSVDAQNRAFVALNQMMSKGTVTAEELKGQLGEALPGAFGIMAKAMGVTEAELGKLMKDGKVLASDVLPKFAKELEKAYGIDNKNRVESLAASTTRLSNAWTEFVRTLNSGSGILSKSLIMLIDLIRDTTLGLKFLAQSSKEYRAELNKDIENKGYKGALDYLTQIKDKQQQINDAKFLRTASQERIDELREENKLLQEQYRLIYKQSEGRTSSSAVSHDLKELNKRITDNISSIFFNKGQIEGVNELLDENTKKLKINTDATTKAKKEHIRLNFDYIKSEYELKKAMKEQEISKISDILVNESKDLETRLKFRKELSEKSIELMLLELQMAHAINKEKQQDDIEKNNVAYHNKTITTKEYLQNIIDLNRDYRAKDGSADVEYSNKYRELINADLEFYKKIEDEKKEFVNKTSELILTSEKDKYKKIADNEKLLVGVRQKAFLEYLKLARKELDINKIKELSNSKSTEETNYILEKYKELNTEMDKMALEESPEALRMNQLVKEVKAYFSEIKSGFLDQAGLGSLNFFMKLDEFGQSTFDRLIEGADTMGKKIAIAFNGMADVAQEVFSFINQQSEMKFQAEFDRLEAQKEIQIKFAGESTTAKAEIERQYEERRLEIEKRKAEQQKKTAIFNIIVDTAQAVVGALAEQNYGGALLYAAIGAAQLAIVNSQELPAYAEGTLNHPGGPMLVNDGKGSNPIETVVTPDGKATQYKGRNVITSAPKGSKVFTHEQWQNELDTMLHGNGIFYGSSLTPVIEVESNGITAQDMDRIFKKHLGNLQTNQMILDKNGFTNVMIKNGQKKIDLNNRVSFKGIQV